jgi:hypothetical protein
MNQALMLEVTQVTDDKVLWTLETYKKVINYGVEHLTLIGKSSFITSIAYLEQFNLSVYNKQFNWQVCGRQARTSAFDSDKVTEMFDWITSIKLMAEVAK